MNTIKKNLQWMVVTFIVTFGSMFGTLVTFILFNEGVLYVGAASGIALAYLLYLSVKLVKCQIDITKIDEELEQLMEL